MSQSTGISVVQQARISAKGGPSPQEQECNPGKMEKHDRVHTADSKLYLISDTARYVCSANVKENGFESVLVTFN